MPGHIINNCFKIHGYQLGHKFYGRPQEIVTFTNQNTSSMVPTKEQIGDTNQVGLTRAIYSTDGFAQTTNPTIP